MDEANQYACDGEYSSVVGPIKYDKESNDKQQPVFFFSNEQPLETDKYEFHKNRKSLVANSSYVYMLYELDNIDVGIIEDYLATDISDSTIQMLKQEENAVIRDDQHLYQDIADLGIGKGIAGLFNKAQLAQRQQMIDKFRIQVSLGSQISSIKSAGPEGFIVNYINGDICNKTTGQTYKSQIRFQCDMSDEQQFPEFVEYQNDNCGYKFLWRSKYACA